MRQILSAWPIEVARDSLSMTSKPRKLGGMGHDQCRRRGNKAGDSMSLSIGCGALSASAFQDHPAATAVVALPDAKTWQTLLAGGTAGNRPARKRKPQPGYRGPHTRTHFWGDGNSAHHGRRVRWEGYATATRARASLPTSLTLQTDMNHSKLAIAATASARRECIPEDACAKRLESVERTCTRERRAVVPE